jgi:hypothetical protein
MDNGNKDLAILFSDVVNGADIGMIQSGGRLGLAPETGESLAVSGKLIGQELQRTKRQVGCFGFVDDAHFPAAQFLGEAIVRDGSADHFGKARP